MLAAGATTSIEDIEYRGLDPMPGTVLTAGPLRPAALGSPHPHVRRRRMRYEGSCHCGGIRFEVEGQLEGALACNCSICSRRASLLWFVPRDELRLLTPEENVSTYLFNKHVIKHRFCANCGIHAFGEAADPTGKRMAAINIRCLDGIDLDAVPVRHFDGRAV
jgi:hypothetical protein